jgi:hypothetical protein
MGDFYRLVRLRRAPIELLAPKKPNLRDWEATIRKAIEIFEAPGFVARFPFGLMLAGA